VTKDPIPWTGAPEFDPNQIHRYGGDEDWPQTALTFAHRARLEIASLLEQLTEKGPRSMRFTPDYSDIEGTSVFVQWKGTNVCLDYYCECGVQGHFDGFFAYQLRCGACGKVFDMPHSFALVPQQRMEFECIQDVEMDEP
jgi:hypothetical protein